MFKKVINKFIGKDLAMTIENPEAADDPKASDTASKALSIISEFISGFYKGDSSNSVPYLLIENNVNQILYQREEVRLGTKLRQVLESLYRELLHDLANRDPANRLEPFNNFAITHKKFIELGTQIFSVYEQNVLCFQSYNTFAKLCNGILQSELKKQDIYLEYLLNDLIAFITSASDDENTTKLIFANNIVEIILNCRLHDIFLKAYCNNAKIHWKSYLYINNIDNFENFISSLEKIIDNERIVFETLKLNKHFQNIKTTILKEVFDKNAKNILVAFDAMLDQERYDLANKIIQIMIEIDNVDYIAKYFKESQNAAFIKMESLNEVISELEEINKLSKDLKFEKGVFSELKILLHNTLNTEKEISPQNFAEAVDTKIRMDGKWENMVGYWELMRLLNLKNELFEELYKGFFDRILNKISLNADIEIFLNLITEYGEESLKKFKVLLMDIYKSFKFNRGDFTHWADENIDSIQKTQMDTDNILEANFLAKSIIEEFNNSEKEPDTPFKYFVLILDRMCWPYDELTDPNLNFDGIKDPFKKLITVSKEQFKERNPLADLNYQSLYNTCEVNYNSNTGREITLKLNLIQSIIIFGFDQVKKWDIKNLAYYLKIDEAVILKNVENMNNVLEVFNYNNGVLTLNESILEEAKSYIDFTKEKRKESFDVTKIRSIMFTEQNKEETLTTKNKALKAFIVRKVKSNHEIHQKELLNEVSKYLDIKVDYHDISSIIDNLIESTILKRSNANVDNLVYTA